MVQRRGRQISLGLKFLTNLEYATKYSIKNALSTSRTSRIAGTFKAKPKSHSSLLIFQIFSYFPPYFELLSWTETELLE